jgi:peptidoglycan hydrolase-like protein with peptidoglycan-binding domain
VRRKLAVAVLVAATALAAVAAALGFGGKGDPAPVRPSGPAATAQITRQTLTDAASVSADIGYGDATPVTSRAAGTLTWLPPVGAVLDRGAVLFKADELPTVLLLGQLPMYRPLTVGVAGADVRQFETNLRALGYTGFTVDNQFSQDTANAVKRWQQRLGVDQTGTVDMARCSYAPEPVRVSEHLVRVGASATGDLIKVTGTTKLVTASVPADAGHWVVVGRQVRVTLIGGQYTPGVIVSAVRQQQDSGTGGAGTPASIKVTVTVAAQDKLASDQVELRYVVEERENVLTVPVAALLALPQGGYGLELADGRTVAVKVGMFADGQVEISGAGLSEGMKVGMPR